MAKAIIAAVLWVLVGIMLGSYLERQVAQPTNVRRKIEGDNAQRTQSADQKRVNDFGSEQKPPAPLANMCFLSMNGSIAPLDYAEVLYYPDDTPDCLHRPHVDPSWHAALVRHLHQHRSYPNDILSRGMVLLGFTVDRSGHVFNREMVTADQSNHILNREMVTADHSRIAGRDSEPFSMIDRAQPLPPFPDSMTEAKLDLIVPIYRPEKPTPPDRQLEPILRFPR
jgi:protein TonB